jgi:thiamine-phosphate pyrophosphorylase
VRRDLGDRLRLYVVTSGAGAGHEGVTEAAVAGGATAVQLRAPELHDDELLPLARRLAERCRSAGVLFVVNDRVEVAVASGADGVHVGQGDELAGVRVRIGSERVLGISVRGAADVAPALDHGADYLGATVWATATKPEAVPGGLRQLAAVAAVSPVPVVGIGGIDARNAAEVLGAGAAGVAVISAVSQAPDPEVAVQQLRAAVEGWRRVTR